MDANAHSAVYFQKTKRILDQYPAKPVTVQVFQRGTSVIAGTEIAAEIIRQDATGPVKIKALSDGDIAEPWEPVMFIEGNLADFVATESMYLGILARMSRVATNVRAVVKAARGKQIIFMADRFDIPGNQPFDGYAAKIGGASSVVTEAMSTGFGQPPVGTMPHALIAAFGGDVVKACWAYHQTFPDEPITALVDFNNNCVVDSLRCLEEFGDKLRAVRLDTSGNMIDESLLYSGVSPEVIRGVNEHLVRRVRVALDTNGGRHVKIIVSGGFTPEKIGLFEDRAVPVDAYGVGSSLIKNGVDFTADVVLPVAKKGRSLKITKRLKEI